MTGEVRDAHEKMAPPSALRRLMLTLYVKGFGEEVKTSFTMRDEYQVQFLGTLDFAGRSKRDVHEQLEFEDMLPLLEETADMSSTARKEQYEMSERKCKV